MTEAKIDKDVPLPEADEPEVQAQSEGEPIPEPEGDTEIIETDYEIGQDNIATSWKLEFDIHQVVFTVSALGIVAFTFLTMAYQAELEPLFVGLRGWLTGTLDWFFLLSGNIFGLFVKGG